MKARVYKGGNRWEGNGLETAANVWVLFYFETESLSLSFLFLLLSGLCFNLFCFVMEKWESALKCKGGIGFRMG